MSTSTKTKYTIRSAFKRWCQLTGDYGGENIQVVCTPRWFRVELVNLFDCTIKSHKGRNYTYIVELSDTDLLKIKTFYRDKWLMQNGYSNSHTYRADLKHQEQTNNS